VPNDRGKKMNAKTCEHALQKSSSNSSATKGMEAGQGQRLR
jgi:hypothetical protein